MDIYLIDKNSLKIKSKKASFIIDPQNTMPKNNADAVILLKDLEPEVQKVSEFRLVIKGPGEYELGGVKITATGINGDTVYSLNIDGINTVLGNAEAAHKLLDKLGEYQIAILKVDGELDQSLITAIEPSIAIFYGNKARDAAKLLKGAESLVPVQKYSTTKEKLPAEMEIIVLE